MTCVWPAPGWLLHGSCIPSAGEQLQQPQGQAHSLHASTAAYLTPTGKPLLVVMRQPLSRFDVHCLGISAPAVSAHIWKGSLTQLSHTPKLASSCSTSDQLGIYYSHVAGGMVLTTRHHHFSTSSPSCQSLHTVWVPTPWLDRTFTLQPSYSSGEWLLAGGASEVAQQPDWTAKAELPTTSAHAPYTAPLRAGGWAAAEQERGDARARYSSS